MFFFLLKSICFFCWHGVSIKIKQKMFTVCCVGRDGQEDGRGQLRNLVVQPDHLEQ